MSEPVTRDHLANERTFLAWVRTSISLLGFGVVIAKLRFLIAGGSIAPAVAGHTGVRSTLLGLAFAAMGVLTLAFAYFHYEAARRAIDAGDYQSPVRVLRLFAGLLFLLGLVSIGYLLTLAPLGTASAP